MFVLGVDPGVSRCGYAVVEPSSQGSPGHRSRGQGARALALGVLTTPPDEPLHLRLAELQRELQALLDEFRPAVLAVERVLFQQNVRTAISVGQASGIAMAEAASRRCDVVQYSPNQVKEAVTGYGAATKEQVQDMVQTLLGLAERPSPPDAADAAAVALCHLAIAPTHAAAARATASDLVRGPR